MAALVIITFFFFQRSDSLLGSWLEPYSEPNWNEVPEKHIVKNSIPITLLEENNGKCKVTAQKFDVIIEHSYFVRGNELAEKLNYEKEDETLIPRVESGSILYSRFPTFFGINVDTMID